MDNIRPNFVGLFLGEVKTLLRKPGYLIFLLLVVWASTMLNTPIAFGTFSDNSASVITEITDPTPIGEALEDKSRFLIKTDDINLDNCDSILPYMYYSFATWEEALEKSLEVTSIHLELSGSNNRTLLALIGNYDGNFTIRTNPSNGVITENDNYISNPDSSGRRSAASWIENGLADLIRCSSSKLPMQYVQNSTFIVDPDKVMKDTRIFFASNMSYYFHVCLAIGLGIRMVRRLTLEQLPAGFFSVMNDMGAKRIEYISSRVLANWILTWWLALFNPWTWRWGQEDVKLMILNPWFPVAAVLLVNFLSGLYLLSFLSRIFTESRVGPLVSVSVYGILTFIFTSIEFTKYLLPQVSLHYSLVSVFEAENAGIVIWAPIFPSLVNLFLWFGISCISINFQSNITPITKENSEFGAILKDVSVKYPKAKKNSLNKVNVEMKTNEIVVLLGHNGSGKTTTIRTLLGKVKTTDGSLSVINGNVGLCPQHDDALLSDLTVREHLDIFSLTSYKSEPVKLLDLAESFNKFPQELSGGQRRRLSLALALVGNPNLVMVDEPTSGVDPAHRKEIWTALKASRKPNRLFILSTQFLDEADVLGDNLIVLREGKILDKGTPLELKTKSGAGFVLRVLGNGEDANRIQRLLPKDSSSVQEIAGELSWRLPGNDEGISAIPELLDEIEKLGLPANVAPPSLEQVFLEMMSKAGDKINVASAKVPKDVEELNYMRRYFAIIRKKLLIVRKDSTWIINQFSVFLALFIIGIILTFGYIDPKAETIELEYHDSLLLNDTMAIDSSIIGGVISFDPSETFAVPYLASYPDPIVIHTLPSQKIPNESNFGLIFAWVYTLALTWIVSGLLTLLVSERRWGVERQQILSGLKLYELISINYISDLFLLILIAISMSILTNVENRMIVFKTMILTIFTLLPQGYLVSMFSNSEAKFQSILVGIWFWVSAYGLGIAWFSSTLNTGVLSTTSNVIDIVFSSIGFLYAYFKVLIVSVNTVGFLDLFALGNRTIEDVMVWPLKLLFWHSILWNMVLIFIVAFRTWKSTSKRNMKGKHLSVKSLKRNFTGMARPAVDNVSFDVSGGEILGLLGINGAGKSSVVKIVCGLDSGFEGEVSIQGRPGVCPQSNDLFPSLTVLEHVKFYSDIIGSNTSTGIWLIEHLNLNEYINVSASALSGGNKRKLCLAISLLGSPQVLLLDEPTTGMDPFSRRYVWFTLDSFVKSNQSSIVLVSHYMKEMEVLSNRCAIMKNGKMLSLAPPLELQKRLDFITIFARGPNPKKVNDWMLNSIPNSKLVEEHHSSGSVYSITGERFVDLFRKMLEKDDCITEWIIEPASLESYFLSVSRDITDTKIDIPNINDIPSEINSTPSVDINSTPSVDINVKDDEIDDLKAEIARLKAENEKLRKANVN